MDTYISGNKFTTSGELKGKQRTFVLVKGQLYLQEAAFENLSANIFKKFVCMHDCTLSRKMFRCNVVCRPDVR
jgi:hypothetical protein